MWNKGMSLFEYPLSGHNIARFTDEYKKKKKITEGE